MSNLILVFASPEDDDEDVALRVATALFDASRAQLEAAIAAAPQPTDPRADALTRAMRAPGPLA